MIQMTTRAWHASGPYLNWAVKVSGKFWKTLSKKRDDEDNLEFLEAALDNLEFTESMELMPLLDISEDDEGDDLDLFEDLYDLDEDLDD